MDSLKDIKKLFALVSIAFAICFATGVWKDKEQQSILIKNHGYKECSFFKYGQNNFLVY